MRSIRTKLFSLVALLVIVMMCAPLLAARDFDNDGDAKVAGLGYKGEVYTQALKDKVLNSLVDQVRRNPGDERLVDQMLMRMPLSPLDMFQIRMESQVREYIVPKETLALHQRWLAFHPEVNLLRSDVQAAVRVGSVVNPMIAIMAATVGTNRNTAATYTPAPAAYDGEIQLAVNKNNANQMVAGANTWNATCDTQSVVSSIDGGANWRWSCTPTGSQSTPNFGLTCQAGEIWLGSDPAIYWDNSNNVFFNYMLMCCNSACQSGTANPRSSMVTAKSTDSGLTWAAPAQGKGIVVNHLAAGQTAFDDKQFYNIDTTPSSPYYGRHYSCWDTGNDNQFAYSADGGQNWTQVNLPGVSGKLDLGCEIAVQSNGTVHEIFNVLTCPSACTGEATYYIRSTNGGASWSTPVLIKSHLVYSNFNGTANKIQAANQRGINPFGSIDVDNTGGTYNGRLYVVYSDMASGTDMNLSDTYVSRSTDNGVTWSAGVKVNDDATSTAQFQGTLVVDQTNGNVFLAWEDGRNDTTNKRKIDVYASRSTDGGATFEANTKVTAASAEFTANTGISYTDENNTDNTGANGNNYGEYLGVDAIGGKGYVAWTDSRGYYPSTNTQGTAQKENIGFAVVTFGAATPDFGVAASPSTLSINQGASGTSTITVSSLNSFNSAVALTASGLPTGVTASFAPTSVTPPANGSGTSTLTLTASASATTGAATVTVTGTSGATTHTATISLTVNIVDTTPPTTSLTAPAAGATLTGSVAVSANASDNIGVTKVEFYAGASLLGTDTTSPYSISWDTNTVTNGTYSLTSKAYDTVNSTSSSPISVTVSNIAGPPALTASYNATTKAPVCGSGGKSCDSGATIINGRGTMTNGVEPNQPNTINAACADGTSGTYHTDESIDRMSIATNDSTALAGGKAVTVSVTVWCYGTTDALDLYYASTVPGTGSPTFTLIGTQTCTAGGVAKVFTAGYTLPTGATLTTQDIRANYRFGGSAGSCVSGSYNDHDDLVFGVNQAAPTPDFSIAATSPVTVTQGTSGTSTVTIGALNGFTGTVSFGTTGLPSGVTAAYSPTTVTTSGTSTLTLTASGTATTGTATVTVTGTSGSLTHSSTISLTVNPAATPNFTIGASPTSVTVTQGTSGTSTITIGAQNGFTGTVSFSTTGLPSGVTASYSPTTVTTSGNSTLTLTASLTATTGTATVTVTGTSGSLTHSATISLTVNPTGVPDLTAVYSATYKAPSCAAGGKSCDTGATLVNGRGTMTSGNELNRPNTLNATCADGNSGTYHGDESLDRVKIATNDGTALAAGKAVTITFTAWCYSSTDKLDVYYATNVTTPSWVLVGTQSCTAAGVKAFTATYTLPSGSTTQAVRGNLRYSTTAGSCTTGGYDDRDDLVFGVN
jgi:hypothetical protein